MGSIFDAVNDALDQEDESEKYKAILQHLFPGEQFILSCEYCGKPWEDGHAVSDIKDHTDAEHGTDKAVRLNMVWIGPGPAPKGSKPPKKKGKNR